MQPRGTVVAYWKKMNLQWISSYKDPCAPVINIIPGYLTDLLFISSCIKLQKYSRTQSWQGRGGSLPALQTFELMFNTGQMCACALKLQDLEAGELIYCMRETMETH